MDEHDTQNTIECPHCGAQAFYELTRCPECGRSFYPLDEDSEDAPEEVEEAGIGSLILGVFTGWLAAGALSFMVFFVASRQAPAPPSIQWIFSAAGILSALAGAMLAGVVAGYRPVLQGVLVGVFHAGTYLLLQSAWVSLTPQVLAEPVFLLTIAGLIAGGGLGGWLTRTISSRASRSALDFEDEYQLYRNLLAKVRYDHSAAARLIDYERDQRPGDPQIELIKSAIQRWERDNR